MKTDTLYRVLIMGIDLYLPTKTVKIHQTDKPWITPLIKKLISLRQAAFTAGNTFIWCELRNRVKREIEKAEVSYTANRVRNLQETEPQRHGECY